MNKPDKPFMRAKDIQEYFGVSRNQSYAIIRKVKEQYKIDENRLPVRACVPTKELLKFYQI
ncbi:MAG: hypothetical protein ACK5L6_03770 [Anaerorhabdus sp.]|uniref:hypothetical protein n=1 Tax=Anaerorhabdus sp. TaxID=1872524 RepID=UPI003A8AEE57